MPKESCQPHSLISSGKHNWRNGLLLFLSQKVWNNYKPRITEKLIPQSFFFFQHVPFSVTALIFEPIKLRQEWATESCCSGERNSSSHWANIEISGSHQNLIKLVWCLGGAALDTGGHPISQTKWAWCVFAGEQQTCMTSNSLHSEADTEWENICTLFIITPWIPHASKADLVPSCSLKW